MIELFGFWFNVTWISGLYFALPVFLVIWILSKGITQVTENEYKGRAFLCWFIYECSHEKINLFNRFVVHEGFVYTTLGVSLFTQFFSLFYIIHSMHNSEWTLTYSEIVVETIAIISGSGLQHLTGWVAVLLATYILSIQALRRLYRMYVKVDELLKKDNEG